MENGGWEFLDAEGGDDDEEGEDSEEEGACPSESFLNKCTDQIAGNRMD